MHYIKWLGVLVALSCVGRTSGCKSVAKLKLIKRMDRCNVSQYRVNKSGLWQVYWAHSFRETNLLLLCTQIRNDCRGAQPNTEMQTWTSDAQKHHWCGATMWGMNTSSVIFICIYPSRPLSTDRILVCIISRWGGGGYFYFLCLIRTMKHLR